MMLRIVEEVTYNVSGDGVYDAMRKFLNSPNDYLNAVEERDVYVFTDDDRRAVRSLTSDEDDEVFRAENDS